jgi:hypothetical protein
VNPLRGANGYANMAAVVAYRMTPRSLGYAIAAVAAFAIVSGAIGGLEKSAGVGAKVLFAALAAAGAVASLGIAAWARAAEVRAYDAGLMSIGLTTVALIRWQDIQRFEVDRYRSSPFAVYAVLDDGSRVGLEPLRGGSSQGARIHQLSDALGARLRDEQLRHGSSASRPPWPRAPVGWRRRAHVVEAHAY